jgi:inosine triphosphate pyrophosphatase
MSRYFCRGSAVVAFSVFLHLVVLRYSNALISTMRTRYSNIYLYAEGSANSQPVNDIPESLDCGYQKTKKITFVSSNPKKIAEVKMILGSNFPWEIKVHNFDLVEPQATPIEVSRAKCKQAVEMCDGAVVVEDTSLCFNALNGLPGPYIKWFYEAVGNEGLAKMLDGFEDKSAYAQCVLSYCLGPGQEIKTVVGSVDGTIVYPSGPGGFGWDPIFMVSIAQSYLISAYEKGLLMTYV